MFLLVKGLLGPVSTLPLPPLACSKFFLSSPTDCVLKIVEDMYEVKSNVRPPWWLSGERIHLAMQEIQVQFLDREDPTRKGKGNPLEYSCLGNDMKKGASWATVHGVAKSQARLSD